MQKELQSEGQGPSLIKDVSNLELCAKGSFGTTPRPWWRKCKWLVHDHTQTAAEWHCAHSSGPHPPNKAVREFPDETVGRRHEGPSRLATRSRPQNKSEISELISEAVQNESRHTHASQSQNRQQKLGPGNGGESSLTNPASPATTTIEEEKNTASEGDGGELSLTNPEDCRSYSQMQPTIPF